MFDDPTESWLMSTFKPEPMPAPVRLYRSVSLPELMGIHRNGVVIGGGNLFNFGDPRHQVFFADTLDDRLIRQGDYIDRQVTFALWNHEVRHRCSRTEKAVDDIVALILSEMRDAGIPYEPDLEWEFRWDVDRRPFRRAIKRRGKAHRHKFRALFERLERAERDSENASHDYDALYQKMSAERGKWLSRQPCTSAILVTRPLQGGLLYSPSTGGSLHGGSEYGFEPGQVSLEDVVQIILIRFQKEVGRCHPRELPTILQNVAWDQLEPPIPFALQHERVTAKTAANDSSCALASMAG